MSNPEQVSSALSDTEKAYLEKFRQCVQEDVERSQRPGYSTDRLASLGSAVCIAARHFGSVSPDNTAPSREYRQQLLAIAAELTSIPLEPLPQPDGTVAQAWRPARGEVGWLPYSEGEGVWLEKDVRALMGRVRPQSRHQVLSRLLADGQWAFPDKAGATVYDTSTGEACTVAAWWPSHPTTGARGEHVMVTWALGQGRSRNSEILSMPERYTWEVPARCQNWPEGATQHVCESCGPEEIAKLN